MVEGRKTINQSSQSVHEYNSSTAATNPLQVGVLHTWLEGALSEGGGDIKSESSTFDNVRGLSEYNKSHVVLAGVCLSSSLSVDLNRESEVNKRWKGKKVYIYWIPESVSIMTI